MKRNIQKLQEQLRKLQAQIKETEKEFYVALGKAFESELQNETTTIEKLKEIYEQKRKEFGYAGRV